MIKEKIRQYINRLMYWALPELLTLNALYKALNKKTKKEINCEDLILIGTLCDSNINIKPDIKPEIILSQFSLEGALKILGNNQMVSHNNFQSYDVAIKTKFEEEYP